ncbi:MAG: hypothetical protein AAFY29_02785 [Pseudomonadota bacterium]
MFISADIVVTSTFLFPLAFGIVGCVAIVYEAVPGSGSTPADGGDDG